MYANGFRRRRRRGVSLGMYSSDEAPVLFQSTTLFSIPPVFTPKSGPDDQTFYYSLIIMINQPFLTSLINLFWNKIKFLKSLICIELKISILLKKNKEKI